MVILTAFDPKRTSLAFGDGRLRQSDAPLSLYLEEGGTAPSPVCRRQVDVVSTLGGHLMTASVAILLAEDEPILAGLMADALTEGGFEVVTVAAGKYALEEIEDDPTRFAAVVTDTRLGPGPDGWRIAQRARELVPNMPVIYMTGDSGVEWPSKGVLNSVLLPKPFVPAQLVTAAATLITDAAMQPPVGNRP